MDASGLKKRKRSFSADIDIIVSGVESHFDTLKSAFTNTVTNNAKKKIWKDITTKLNATGDITRIEEEVRKKWTDMKGCVKKAESARSLNAWRTGSGPSRDDLTATEKREVFYTPLTVTSTGETDCGTSTEKNQASLEDVMMTAAIRTRKPKGKPVIKKTSTTGYCITQEGYKAFVKRHLNVDGIRK